MAYQYPQHEPGPPPGAHFNQFQPSGFPNPAAPQQQFQPAFQPPASFQPSFQPAFQPPPFETQQSFTPPSHSPQIFQPQPTIMLPQQHQPNFPHQSISPPPPQMMNPQQQQPTDFGLTRLIGGGGAGSPPGVFSILNPTDHFGKMADAAASNVQSSLGQYGVSVESARALFAVDTTYVRRKLFSILCPYIPSKQSADDTARTDLYIPLMSLLTSALILSIAWASSGRGFSPEVISQNVSSAFATIILEGLVIQLMLKLLDKPLLAVLELLSYVGYIFVPATVTLLASLLFGSMTYYLVLIYSGISMGIFFARSISLRIHPPAERYHAPPDREKFMLYGLGALQLFVLWFVSLH